MVNNYFFIDGSALLSQIRELRRYRDEFKGRKLHPVKFINYFTGELSNILEGAFKRAVFYFPEGEQDLEDYILKSGFSRSKNARDITFKFCGKKMRKSKKYEEFLETVPAEFRDRCVKSEKGVDIEICCDALRLAAINRLERLVLLTNDSDFIPLCKTLKDFGSNISLIHLTNLKYNSDLIEECDSYDSVDAENLKKIFDPPIEEKQNGS